MSKPLLMRICTWPSIVIGWILVVGAVMTALGCSDTSRLQGSGFGDWVSTAWVVWAASMGGLLVLIGHGLKNEKPWVRGLVIAYWVVGGLNAVVVLIVEHRPGGKFSFDLVWLLGLIFSWWYFFHKQNVVAYYRSIPGEARAVQA